MGLLHLDIDPLDTPASEALAFTQSNYRANEQKALQEGRFAEYPLMPSEPITIRSTAGRIEGLVIRGSHINRNGGTGQSHLYVFTRNNYQVRVQLWAPLAEPVDATEQQIYDLLNRLRLPTG